MATGVKNNNKYARCFAVEKIEDQKVLRRIILNTAEDWAVRCAAIRVYKGNKNILDQISSDKNQNVRRAVAERLENQAILEKLAVDDPYWGVRYYATRRLHDQIILEWIAFHDSDHNVRSAAVELLQKQSALEQIALNDTHWLVRLFATKKLENQAVLKQIAQNDAEHDVCCAAVIELERQGAFERVSVSDDGWRVYYLAQTEDTIMIRTGATGDRHERRIRSFATPRTRA